MKKVVSTILSIVMMLSITAQPAEQPKLNNSMIPPSPDAASLGKFGVFPVTLYTGSPNISIPIAEVSTSKIKLPISLAYNYNGYRLTEEASSIGMGWALQAGGVITRMVKGRTDDEPGLQKRWDEIPTLPDIAENAELLTLQSLNVVDAEPDIYTFSFNGYSGKFILIGHRAFLFPKQDLVITENGGGFYVHTPDGSIYDFSTWETTDPVNANNPAALQPYKSSWYLTNVRNEHSNEYISFTYTNWQQRQRPGPISESLTKKTGLGGAIDCKPIPCFTSSFSSVPGALVSAKRLASISSPNMLVTFIPSNTPRMDMDGNNHTPVYSIKTIEIYNKPNNELIKKIDLDQDYFGDNINPNFINSHLKLKKVQTTGYKYKKENGQTVTEAKQEPPYVFSYINEQAAYPKSGRGFDKWGYYNGANGNLTLFGSDIPENFPTIPMGDREVHVDYLKNGILEKITYPTGGHSIFEYENNIIRLPQYGDYIPVTQYASKSVLNPNPNNPSSTDSTIGTGYFIANHEQNIVVTFGRTPLTPLSSPPYSIGTRRVFKLYWLPPQYQYDDPNAPAPTLYYVSIGLGQGEQNQVITDPIPLIAGNYRYTVTCNNNWASAFVNFSYTSLELYMGSPGPGMRIAAIKSFDNIDIDNPKTVKQYTYGNGAKPINLVNGYGNPPVTTLRNACEVYETKTYNAEYSSPLYTLYNEQFFYPKVTEVNFNAVENGRTVYEYNGTTEINNVNLIAQTDYKGLGGTKVREVTNEYGDPFNGYNSIGFFGLTFRLTDKIIPRDTSCHIIYTPRQLYMSSQPQDIEVQRNELYAADSYVMWSIPNLPLSKTEKVYDEAQTNPNTTTTIYSYESNKHLNPTKIVVNNSKGETITTQTKYPLDYNIIGCQGLNAIDNTFKQLRVTQSQTYQTNKMIRYNQANYYIYTNPGTGYYNNNSNQTLLNYLAANNQELTYKNDYAATLNWISASGIDASACYNPTTQTGANAALINMMRFNNQTPIEKIISITKGSDTYLQSALKTDFSLFSNNGNYWTQPKTIYTTEVQPNTVLTSTFLSNSAAYYKPQIEFTFDNKNIVQQSKTDDVKMAYVWDYNDNYAIAEATNAQKEDIAAISFESDGKGGFDFAGTPTDDGVPTVTGKKYYNLSLGNINKSNLNPSKTYTISYWGVGSKQVNGTLPTTTGRTINGYTYYEHQLSTINSIAISGSGNIDEVRVYPTDALMTTYTYNPSVGVTSKCDANNRIAYYTYDALARLSYIRDQDNNILKKLCYNYAGEQENCTDCTNFAPNWQNTATTQCQTNSYGVNTGVVLQQQKDINNCSPSYDSTRWINTGTNTTTCPIPNYINLTSTNTYGTTGYVAKYTPIPFYGTPGNGTPYYFNVPATTGLQPLGSVPEGTYTVEIYRTTTPIPAIFRGGCPKPVVTGTSATFNNINVATCNSIVVTLEQ